MSKNHFKYTGVGSRNTPEQICTLFMRLGFWLWRYGGVLRSGGADGADAAFEYTIEDQLEKEIYLPMRHFNGHKSKLYDIDEAAFIMAQTYVGHWHNCNDFARRAHARNCYQVLGKTLDDPSKFLVCWTQNAKLIGGTRTAIMIARDYNVPVFNYGKSPKLVHTQLIEFLKTEGIYDVGLPKRI